MRNGHQLVLAAGGDGTIHEAANGLLGSQTILATLPAGTTNCFARDLGLPSPNGVNPYWLIEASERLMAGTVHAIDVGECSNGRSFILWAAAGVDSRIVESVEPRFPSPEAFRRRRLFRQGDAAVSFISRGNGARQRG